MNRPSVLVVAVLAFLGAAAWGASPPVAVAQDVAGIDISDGCASIECHGNMLSRATVHSAVEMEMCDGCHIPRDDRHEFEPMADPPDLCFECHDAFPTDQKMHEIVEMGECLACHDPHGSDGKYLLLTKTVVETCAECHDHPGEEFPYQHGPARDGECLKCHSPHYAKYSKLLNKDGSELCLSCHNRNVRRKDKSIIPSIENRLTQKQFTHEALEVESCLVCHGPHGGQSTPSLREAFPTGLYSSFSPDAYELCFQCHDAELATEETSRDTGFRNGSRNLHYLHVNKTKGRSCRICHEPHATDLPHMLRENVPFGEWSFELRYKETETGGSCWPGCHREQTYDRSLLE